MLLLLIPAMVRSGDKGSFIGYRREAVALARQLGDEHLLVRAITCGNASTWQTRTWESMDADFVAEVTASLATAHLTDVERCLLDCAHILEQSVNGDDETMAQAVHRVLARARRTGEPDVIALSLYTASIIFVAEFHASERRWIRVQLRDVAERHGLSSYQLYAHFLDFETAAVRGDVQEARRALDAATALASKLQVTSVSAVLKHYEGGLAAMTGDYARAADIYREVSDLLRGPEPGNPRDDILAGGLFSLRLAQGRLAEIVDLVRGRYETVAREVWVCEYACCLAAAGQDAQARAVLAAGPLTPSLARYRLMGWVACARAAVMLGDEERVAAMYQVLLPFRDQIAGAALGFPFEPVAHTLGALALSLNDVDHARDHLARALGIATRCGNSLWIDLINADLARCGTQTASA